MKAPERHHMIFDRLKKIILPSIVFAFMFTNAFRMPASGTDTAAEISQRKAIDLANQVIEEKIGLENQARQSKRLDSQPQEEIFDGLEVSAQKYSNPDNPCRYDHLLVDSHLLSYDSYLSEYKAHDDAMKASLTAKEYFLVRYQTEIRGSHTEEFCVFLDTYTGKLLYFVKP